MLTKKHCLIGVSALLLLLSGILIGRYALAPHGTMAAMEHDVAGNGIDEREVLYWYDPMYPQQRFDQPGPSPFMDMDLVPRYADDATTKDASSIRIDPAMVQNLGIRSVEVVNAPATSQLDLTGLVAFDDRALTRLQSPVEAFVDKVWPLTEGDAVSKAQPLIRLRVPAWTGAQREWLAVLGSGDPDLIAAGRQRLLSLGMSTSQIAVIERQHAAQDTWTIVAPHDGVIRKLNARAGMTLPASALIAEIQSINPVWVEIAVPEKQIQQVHRGDPVDVHIVGLEPAPIETRVSEILPTLDAASRTVPVRVLLPNDRGDLRPGTSARVLIRGSLSGQSLAVPSEALIHTGKRTLVMLDEGEGRYRPQAVQPGAELGEQTVILAGLSTGQRVVVSGQFLLDSEASLQGISVPELVFPDDELAVDSLHYAEGTVEQLADGKIKLKHGPFETLGMPGMTMRFRLANEQVAEGIAEGDFVRIGVSDRDQGLIVERLEKREKRP